MKESLFGPNSKIFSFLTHHLLFFPLLCFKTRTSSTAYLYASFWSLLIWLEQSAGKIGPGFGIGALEELDVEDEDVYAGKDIMAISLIMVVLCYISIRIFMGFELFL